MAERKCVLALGFFDGVHRGHAALLNRTIERAEALGIDPAVMTFDTHPDTLVQGTPVPLINSAPDRAYLIRRLFGIDRVEFFRFTEETMHMPWEEFLRSIQSELGVVGFVVGYDFRFEGDQPGSFNDSIASMERKLFILKDLPLLVDDYKTVADARQMSARRALEENIIRMVCDGLKRSRISADMTAQHDYPARGLCIQTGEELPSETGDSNIARLYVINLAAGNVPLPTSDAAPERKAEMQELWRLAKEGALNESMRGYIAYLAGQADKLPARLDALYREMFDEASRRVSGTHARLPSAVAYIMLGVRMMVEYMAQPGGVSHRGSSEFLYN